MTNLGQRHSLRNPGSRDLHETVRHGGGKSRRAAVAHDGIDDVEEPVAGEVEGTHQQLDDAAIASQEVLDRPLAVRRAANLPAIESLVGEPLGGLLGAEQSFRQSLADIGNDLGDAGGAHEDVMEDLAGRGIDAHRPI